MYFSCFTTDGVVNRYLALHSTRRMRTSWRHRETRGGGGWGKGGSLAPTTMCEHFRNATNTQFVITSFIIVFRIECRDIRHLFFTFSLFILFVFLVAGISIN